MDEISKINWFNVRGIYAAMKLKYFLILIFISLFSTLANSAEFDAKINWAELRQLGLPLSGIIKSVPVKSGDHVEPGDRLLSLDCGLFKSMLKQNKAIVDGMKPAVETARKDKELADELFDRTVLSEIEHKKAELVFIEVSSKYRASVAKYEEQKWRVSHCELLADNKLLILDVHVNAGEMHNLNVSKSVLMTVASRNKMSASADIVLTKAKAMKIGKVVKVKVSGKTYRGRIVSVSYYTGYSGSYSLSGAVQGSAHVEVEFDDFDPQLIGYKDAKLVIQ